MAPQTTTAELAALRAELANPAAPSVRPALGPTERPAAEPELAERNEHESQIQQFVQELQAALNDATEGAEGLIAEHPLPSVSAAFLLGLSVGWLAARGVRS
jgi:ElaB/YqjD/DUF883 family membrane-anchored ribosome-binding protein